MAEMVNTAEAPEDNTFGVREFRSALAFWWSFALGRNVRTTTPKERGFQPRGHLSGLGSIASVRISGGSIARVPNLLDDAQQAAQLDGTGMGIVIQRRRGRPVGDAFAVLAARDLARLLARVVEPTDDLDTPSAPRRVTQAP